MKDVGCVQEEATTIMCDNQSFIALAKNSTNHDRSKHIDVQHYFIRIKIENKVVEVEYSPINTMYGSQILMSKSNVIQLEFYQGLWSKGRLVRNGATYVLCCIQHAMS